MGTLPCDPCNCCSPPGKPPCSPGCCKCPPSGSSSDICFDILECQAYHLAENPVDLIMNWYPVESCCTGMSFTMTKGLGYTMCEDMGGMSEDPDGDTCITTGTGLGMPTGTGVDTFPELWGFKGTVCDGCSGGFGRSDVPPPGLPWSGGWDNEEGWWRQKDCGGMCLKASLCCCPEPFGSGVGGGGKRCGGGASLGERSKACACGITCYSFKMEPWLCHTIANTTLCPPAKGTFHCGPESVMSACSPCSFLEQPMASSVHDMILPPNCPYTGCVAGCETYADTTGAAMGGWSIWDSCPPDIARGQGTCGVEPYTGVSECLGTCPNSSGSSSFMVLVEGVYESQCDCAKGVFNTMCGQRPPPAPESIYDGSGVGFMESVFVKFTALLSEC